MQPTNMQPRNLAHIPRAARILRLAARALDLAVLCAIVQILTWLACKAI